MVTEREVIVMSSMKECKCRCTRFEICDNCANSEPATRHVRFMKYYVTDGIVKVRVSYSLDNRIDGRKCVTLYCRDYGNGLSRMFGDSYINDTDMATDYFDKGRVVLFEDHRFYKYARTRAEGMVL